MADPSRRLLLDRLRENNGQTLGQLCENLAMARQSVTKHLAVLEAANAAGLDARNVVRRGVPDKFIEHGERNELLADIGLSVEALVACVRSNRSSEVAKCG